MLYTGDAGIVPESVGGLAKMMAVIVTVFVAARLTAASEKKMETMLLRTPKSGTPDLTARYRSSGPKARTDDAVFVPGQSRRRQR